jgi:hypothetical protein
VEELRLTPFTTLAEHRTHLEDDRKVHEETQRVGVEIKEAVAAVHEAVIGLSTTVGQMRPIVDAVDLEKKVKNRIRAKWGAVAGGLGIAAGVIGAGAAVYPLLHPAASSDVVVAGPGSATQSPAPLKVHPPKTGMTH